MIKTVQKYKISLYKHLDFIKKLYMCGATVVFRGRRRFF